MKYKAWLIYDQKGAERNAEFIRMHQETGVRMQVEVSLVIAEQISDLSLRFQMERPDFALVRTIQPELTKQLEGFGIPVFNNSFVSEICNDKGKTLAYVSTQSSVPIIPTQRYANSQLSKELLTRFPDHVVKAVDGHGGSQVFRTNETWERICGGIGRSDFVIQPFVRGLGRDIRFYVIGQEIVGAVERQAAGDFRANFSLGGRVRSFSWEESEQKLINEICGLFSFGLVGIDFIMDEQGQLLLNEIEDVAGARMLYQCQPQIRLLEQYFTFILRNLHAE